MKKKKVRTNNRYLEDCPEHPNSFSIGCKSCHQISLDLIETRLMDMDLEIKALLSHAKMDIGYGAESKWGWADGDFTIELDEIEEIEEQVS